MTQDASGEYLRNAVMTASPEQLQMMLYDGATRFARQARDARRGAWTVA
jgi:flagellin-specific chaperone FliS